MYRKEIVLDNYTLDYAMYLDGEIAGFAPTYHDAEVALDQKVFDLIQSSEPTYAPLDVIDLVRQFEADPDVAYAQIATLTPTQRNAQALAIAARMGWDIDYILARWEKGLANRNLIPASPGGA